MQMKIFPRVFLGSAIYFQYINGRVYANCVLQKNIWNFDGSSNRVLNEILQREVSYYVAKTNETHAFQINALIRFSTSSTRFKPHGFIIRKTVCTSSVCMVCFSCICVSSLAGGTVQQVENLLDCLYKCTKNVPYKKLLVQMLFLMKFETCRRRHRTN